MEKYLVYSFGFQPMSDVAADVLCAMLAEVGFDSFQQTDEGVEAYVAQTAGVEESVVSELLQLFPLPDVQVSFSVSELENRDWNEEWEQNGFEPIVVPGLCVIHDTQHDVEPQPYDILIRPRMAFGSGTHETTSQLVELLLREDFSQRMCLDMGCGTGILAICMALRGAKQVVAVDIDEFSVENTRENCELNHISTVDVIHGDASVLSQQPPINIRKGATPFGFDFIVANIHRNIIIADLPQYVLHLNRGGRLMVSGFFTEDIPAVQQAAEQLGLQLIHQQSRNNWVVLVFVKK